MAAPASYPLTRSERLGPSIPGIEGLGDLDHGQGRTAAVVAMAIVAFAPGFGTERVFVTADPGLAKTMHTVGPAFDAAGHGRVADRALADRRSIPLGLHGTEVVVHLVAVGAGLVGELGMGRVVAGLALQVTVTGAVAVQIGAGNRRIGIGGEARVGRSL